ncbi:hypothetical protein Zmor_026832 [Zophobas morio]|uniref:Uncharacterized protein n=1 Tax=Zophobas morio TaxID=2755281 RepID=A0AA38HV67_9CUCU|nr:hypothetical protein Zmor_026832 [Zophobas morio]
MTDPSEEEAIDDDTFSKINTDSQDFKELIAKYGDRIKFKEGFRQLYNRIDEENVITDNNCLETIVVKTNDAPNDTSVYKETQEPIPSTSKGTCSTVYRVDDNLPLARLIKQEFPNEDISTYYIPYVRQNKKTVQCMRGKLVDRYHNQRKKLKKSGVLTTACPSSSLEVHETVEIASTQDYEDDVEDFCCWLRYNTEPWPEVLAKWKATTCGIPRKAKKDVATTEEARICNQPN